MQRRSGRRSHGPGLAGSVMPSPDLPSVPLFFRSLDGPRLIASRAPAQLALKGCATAQAKPCLPPLGGPWWYKSYFPPFLFMSWLPGRCYASVTAEFQIFPCLPSLPTENSEEPEIVSLLGMLTTQLSVWFCIPLLSS